MVIRVLYRLRTLSEQVPFDAATYGYTSPLLSQILLKGGIALSEEDDPLEQIALSLDIIKFHCGECTCWRFRSENVADFETVSDPTYPRVGTVRDLIHAIRHQPKLAKDASSALIDIGQAMQGNALRDEVTVLLGGTLYQEVYVRTSCLQTLQVCNFAYPVSKLC